MIIEYILLRIKKNFTIGKKKGIEDVLEIDLTLAIYNNKTGVDII